MASSAPGNYRNEPIAVVGSGCRFPGGASTSSKLWDLLKNPRPLSQKIPKDRFNVDAFYAKEGSHHGRTNAQYAYFLEEDPYAFDPSFFSIPPNEVDTIDPQQRLLCETVYEGFTSAGLKMEDLRGTPTAVYVGMMQRDFLDHQNYDLDALNMYAATGTSASILSNRVSYVFDWHGPSMTFDTACSSSLVAVHHAVEQLRTGLSKVAVAAGSNLILGPVPFISASKLNMFSPTGTSKMWDKDADGYARGEGVASVVLKTLSQALADGDRIECIIRESGINQDGKTAGITMPNHLSQEALIKQVYERAGLDLNNPADRPSFFEAHGTGTPAGDPQEAQAISSAFFGRRKRDTQAEEPLYVGSVKTIIGHTEGTAGIAGLIKASQAIQHGILPPNMLFNELAPRVRPFYNDLQVVTSQQAWPELKFGQPRRVSVNSFGFGGTNAHVILESYTPSSPAALPSSCPSSSSEPCLAPVVLSAHSETSLRASMQDLKKYLETNGKEVDIKDLAYTLLQRRSNLNVRHSISGQAMSSPQDLIKALERDIPLVEGKKSIAVTSDLKKKQSPVEILGIFTGQGAQWASMGKALLEFEYVRDIVSQLDSSLQDLPEKYRPGWKLMDQLRLEGEESNVNQASYSQPLCCAVQIILTKLAHASGIRFKAVVGHSSGEIACAFAAGFISASQAIRIAHLRGLTSGLAKGEDEKEGAMMAAGTSFDDALELCAVDTFEGRVCVAASNAPESVTLSGDKDALLEVQAVLQEENRFNRLLKVDKAYHSHHMRPCAEPYVEALKACGCDKFDMPEMPSSTWVSSVQEGHVMRTGDLKAEYWRDNLLSPVLFSYAVEQVLVKHQPIEACVEVGPHPTMKGPSIQTIQNCIGSELPYTGLMDRKKNDVEAFSAGLGYLWSQFGSAAVNAETLLTTLSPSSVKAKDLSSELPAYPFDHSRSYRKESRLVKQWLHAERPHLLLGKMLPSSSAASTQWQNFIHQRDIEWMSGHSLTGQTVVPGACYVVMAFEAAVKLAGDKGIQLLEVLDLKINKAVTFDDENSMVELSLQLVPKAEQTTDTYAAYEFTITSCLAREKTLNTSASGTVAVTYGEGAAEILPPHQQEPPHLNNVSIDRFYNMLDEIGYGYANEFRGVSSLRRGDSKACGTLNFHRLQDNNHRNIVMHPATLDVAFQSFIGAYTAPGDRRLRSLLVPTGIDRIALNPWVADRIHVLADQVEFISTSAASVGNAVEGDIEVFDPETQATMLHIEGLSFKPFSPPSAADDHAMFSKWDWGPIQAEALLDDPQYHATEQDKKDVEIIERITYWFMKSFIASLTSEDRANAAFHFTKHITWCEHQLAEAKAGRNAWYQPSWDEDTREGIDVLIKENIAHPFVRLIQRVGEGALQTLRENGNAFDLMDHDGLLTEFYGGTVSYGHSYSYYQTLLEQINHRYQNLDVLEVGAGTGGASRMFLNNDKMSFNSYTFTDISSAFFEKAAEEFQRFEDKMEFAPLDCRRDPTEQEFKANSYDLIIASNVLHATPSLTETLTNVRTLLKPGGKLVIIEVAHHEHTRIGFIFGLFTDWWAGHDEGRVLEPFISYDNWDKVLRKTGFSGVDSRSLDPDSLIFPNGVFATHAVDDLIDRLDDPLKAHAALEAESYAPLVFIGGSTEKTQKILSGLPDVLPSSRRDFDTVPSIRQLIDFDYQPGSTFVVLSEMDEHTFAGMDEEQLDSLQTIFNAAANILWVTEDAWVSNPQQAQTIGLLRTLRMEYPDVQIQCLDVDSAENLKPEFLAETILRLEDSINWQEKGILYTLEPELYLSKGQVIVPRLKPDVEKNNRLNSNRRAIVSDSDPKKDILSFTHDGSEALFKLNEERFVPSAVDKASVRVQATKSLAQSLRIGHLGFFNLVQGVVQGSDETVVALADSNESSFSISSSRIVPLKDESLLPSIIAELVATTMLSDVASGSSVLVFEPPQLYVPALVKKASSSSITLHFASCTTQTDMSEGNWILLHEKETLRNLKQKLSPLISSQLSLFYDLSGDDPRSSSLSQRLSSRLPASCPIRTRSYLFQPNASPSPDPSNQSPSILSQAVVSSSSPVSSSIPLLTGQDLLSTLKSSPQPKLNTLINWQSPQTIPARIRSMETDTLYSPLKSYLLVGLAGDLGRSIARFMIERGARHIVLSSRSPKIDKRWLDDILSSFPDSKILVLPMDASKPESVDAGLLKIKNEPGFSPLGGVAFGPLVLQDVMFKNMDLSMMEMVLAPKVEGARLLNEKIDEELDFFVMFSSFVMVSGNPGQAAYSAANAYTHALAQQRRSKGLAGSTIDIGAVFGVGFIARAGREHEYDVVKFIFDEVNEWELHALFAEAVVAGRDRTEGKSVEVITGMPKMDPANHDRIPYFDDPRFANFKLSDRASKNSDATGGAVGSVKDQLAKADSMEGVRSIINEGLCNRVRGALQLTAADELHLSNPLIDQGIDSLSAVTVASWFTKNMGIDVPLLEILGGASVNDLVESAVGKLTPDMIPLCHDDADGAAAATVAATAAPVGGESSAGSSSADVSGQSTPPSLDSFEDEVGTEREAPLSVNQQYAWKQMGLGLESKTFNSTIGMYMEGRLDMTRLGWAFKRALQRHDAFRTSFISGPDGTNPIQFVMKAPAVEFETVQVPDKAAADQAFKDLESHQYDPATGKTAKVVVYSWSPTDHLLIWAYHRLVGDGWTTEKLFVEVGTLYAGAPLEPAPSFADYATSQRKQLESGGFAKDLEYWTTLFSTPPPRLPTLTLCPGASTDSTSPPTWSEHETSARLNRMIGVRIKDRSRKHKATPMHYYLASFQVLLARLAGSGPNASDISIGIADSNRPTLKDQATMGYFANLLPVRMTYDQDKIFNEALSEAKEQMRSALLHSAVPYGALVEKLGLPGPEKEAAPLFQAVFDYKQGQTESGSIGEAKIVDSRTPRAGSPYDITIEISDDPTKAPLITVKLQENKFSEGDAEVVMNAYLSILSTFSRNPALRVEDGRLDQGAKARE